MYYYGLAQNIIIHRSTFAYNDGSSVPVSLIIILICDAVMQKIVIALSIVPAPPVRIVLRQEVRAIQVAICRVSRVATATTFADNLRIVPATVYKTTH